MAKLLYFNGQPLGDHLVLYRPASVLQTPPAVGTGFLQSIARVDAVSRNLLRSYEFTIALLRATEDAMAHAVEAIQQMQGATGLVQVRIGLTIRATFTDWTLAIAPPPPMAPAFGGRVIEAWPLVFVGERSPQLSQA